MRLLHFADLHLDAPFTWATPAAARKRRENLRTTLLRIVDLAQAEGVDAVFSGGDLYEHERITPDTAGFLRDAVVMTSPMGRSVLAFASPEIAEQQRSMLGGTVVTWPDLAASLAVPKEAKP